MMIRHVVTGTLASLIAAIVALGCDDSAPQQTSRQIIGRWEMSKAFRNNKETQTLSGTFFVFNTDGTMQTNLPSAPGDVTPYEISGSELLQKSPIPYTYTIQAISDSTLTLQLEMRGIDFTMEFHRGVPEPVESSDTTITGTPDTLNTDTIQQ